MIKFSCKNCGQKLNVDDKHALRQAKCPKCGEVVVVPADFDKITFHCQSCGQKISVPQVHAGKKGKCPYCHNIVLIPNDRGKNSSSAPETVQAKIRQKNSKKWIYILAKRAKVVLIVLFFLTILIIVVVIALTQLRYQKEMAILRIEILIVLAVLAAFIFFNAPRRLLQLFRGTTVVKHDLEAARIKLYEEPDPEAERISWIMSVDEISNRWREMGIKYAAAMNQFYERVRTAGRDGAGPKPQDTRQAFARRVIEEIRRANQNGKTEGLRDLFPPAHEPFIHMLNEKGQHLAPLAILDNGNILVGIGYKNGNVVLINETKVNNVTGVLTFGRSPNRKYFAVVREKTIDIHEGWDGPKVTSLAWPKVGPINGIQHVEQIVPFPDGRRVVIATRAAIMAVEPDRAVLLYPRDVKTLEENWANFKGEPFFSSTPYVAISPDGSLISVGNKLAGKHLIFNDRYEIVGDIYPLVDCSPCHTSFSNDCQWLTLSSFWLYQGATIAIPTSRFPGLTIEEKELKIAGWFSSNSEADGRRAISKLDRDMVLINDGARVYAAVWRKDDFVFGDAYGFLFAYDRSAKLLWWHFIGSSIGGIDLSPDSKTLVVTTFAGFLCIIDLDTGEHDPFAIGTATHHEQRRWIFWQNEPKPLVW